MPLARPVPTYCSLTQRRVYMTISLVENMHRMGVVHGDLNLRNFCFARQCDFETAQMIGEEQVPSEQTQRYCPLQRVRAELANQYLPLSVHDYSMSWVCPSGNCLLDISC